MTPIISSPLRLLLLPAPDTPHPTFLDDATYEIQTAYYSASIPVWHDTLPLTPPTVAAFRDEWTSAEAGEVVRAVGAWVVCFRKPRVDAELEDIRSSLTTIREVVEHHREGNGYLSASGEPVLLAVGMKQMGGLCAERGTEEWEDFCGECGGWEWVDGEVGEGDEGKGEVGKEGGRNEFGEKVGMARLKEALEANDWGGDDGDNDDGLSDDLNLGSEDGFGAEAAQMEREMMGLKMAVRGEEDLGEAGDDGVEELENMMLKVQAIKDMGADMPEGERRRFAAKAVRDVMKAL